MGELLKLELDGVLDRAEYFDAAANRAQDLSPVFEHAHDRFLHEIAQQFLQEGRFFGDGWEPLNPEYAAQKLKLFGPAPSTMGILYRTGRLFEALSNEGADEHVKVVTPQSGTFGAVVPYGKYHQRGTSKGGKVLMPQRIIIAMRNRFKRDTFRASVAYILRGRLPEDGEQ